MRSDFYLNGVSNEKSERIKTLILLILILINIILILILIEHPPTQGGE